MDRQQYSSADLISPDDFVSWVFPELFKSRVPRYQAIADQYGYTIDANEAAQVSNEAEFMQLIADTLKED
jgi:hypothetical protein